jgi:phosphate transport system substrate-binding protein
VVILCAGCRKEVPLTDGVLKITGSDAMIQLATAWQEVFCRKRPDLEVVSKAGGTGTGILGLLEGKVAVATASRKIKEEERQRFLAVYKEEPKETLIGYQGVAICVHVENPVSSVSIEELREIFVEKGRITQWHQVEDGGTGEMFPISPPFMGKDSTVLRGVLFKPDSQEFRHMSIANGSSETIEACAREPKSIGFCGFAYIDAKSGVKWLNVSLHRGDMPVEPTMRNVQLGRYAIAKPLYLYTLGHPPAAAAEFVAFAKCTEGQNILRREGFIPIAE